MSSASEGPPPIDPDRIERGARVFEAVYHGVVPLPPPGFLDFVDLMLGQLFAEQWSRPQLGMRDRRLLTLAAVASTGDGDAWAIHMEAALLNEELTDVEAREIVIHLAQYLGYPRVQSLARQTEEVVARVAAERSAD
jgi:4-carboxymuconolactone decarboxylase